ncbi:MAG: hypothetical protein Kow0069_22630 [Promethearchaeota archaeon]
MNPRERFLAAFEGEKPDRVARFVQGVKEDFFALHEEAILDNFDGTLLFNLTFDAPLALGFDAVFAGVPTSVRCAGAKVVDDEEKEHHVGTNGQVRSKTSFYAGGVLTTQEKHDAVWETVEVFDNSDAIRATAEYFSSVEHRIFPVPTIGGVFDQIWRSMGFSRFSREFGKKSQFYRNLIRDYADLTMANVEGVVRATGSKLGIITILDDVAFKGRPMISPTRFESDFVPAYQEITQVARDAGLHVMLHSDGDVTSLVPQLVAAGFEGVQGWEGGADPAVVASKYPNFVVVGFGDVSDVLPFGTPADVEAHVKHLMDCLKPNRRFVVGPSTVIVKEIPLENVVAFVEAAEKYGRY